MIYLLMADHTTREIPRAANAIFKDGNLICCDVEGRIINSFDPKIVVAFGTSEAIKKAGPPSPPSY